MCADLAKAMGYTVQEVGDPHHPFFLQLVNPPEVDRFYHQWRRTEAEAWADAPNPFTSAADKDALVAWLAKQSEDIWWAFMSEMRVLFLDAIEKNKAWEWEKYLMAADKAVIAEAVWRAIQEKQCP